LHGFQIYGSIIELCIFDRSEAYNYKKLDIEQKPDLLIKIIASYTIINNKKIGFNSFIGLNKLKNYITFSKVDGNEAERFYLEDKLITAPQYIVVPDTTCYSTRRLTFKNPEFVISLLRKRTKNI
jgi:hypothetical protein